MGVKIEVPPLGWAARLADRMMDPLMYLLAGTFKESPQCTHRWNNKKLSGEDLQGFDESLMIFAKKAPGSMKSHYIFFFHIPIFGGWRHYAVIEPRQNREWHVGWKTALDRGVSRVKLSGPVRVLEGPTGSLFFGIDAETGEQIPLRKIGKGRIGDGSEFSRIKLL